jgi:hypothetical protein
MPPRSTPLPVGCASTGDLPLIGRDGRSVGRPRRAALPGARHREVAFGPRPLASWIRSSPCISTRSLRSGAKQSRREIAASPFRLLAMTSLSNLCSEPTIQDIRTDWLNDAVLSFSWSLMIRTVRLSGDSLSANARRALDATTPRGDGAPKFEALVYRSIGDETTALLAALPPVPTGDRYPPAYSGPQSADAGLPQRCVNWVTHRLLPRP